MLSLYISCGLRSRLEHRQKEGLHLEHIVCQVGANICRPLTRANLVGAQLTFVKVRWSPLYSVLAVGSGAPHSRIALVVHCLQAVCRRAVCSPGSTLHKGGDGQGELSSLSASTMRDVK